MTHLVVHAEVVFLPDDPLQQADGDRRGAFEVPLVGGLGGEGGGRIKTKE